MPKTFNDLDEGERFVWDLDPGSPIYVKNGDTQIPLGGGFVTQLTEGSRRLDVFPVPPSRFVEDKFFFGDDLDGPTFKGMHNQRDRWNGWCKPLFAEAEAKAICLETQKYDGPDSVCCYFVRDGGYDPVIVCINIGAPHEERVFVVHAEWPLQAGGPIMWRFPDWTWSCLSEAREMEEVAE